MSTLNKIALKSYFSESERRAIAQRGAPIGDRAHPSFTRALENAERIGNTARNSTNMFPLIGRDMSSFGRGSVSLL